MFIKSVIPHSKSSEAQHLLMNVIHDIYTTVCPYSYGSCRLIRYQWATLHDLHGVTWLIKRCHTVRSQFADELNQDICFQGWTILRSQHSWLTFKIKTVLFLHVCERYKQTVSTVSLHLIRFSVFCLYPFSSVFWHLPPLLSIQPLVYLGIPVMASKGKVRGEFCLLFSCCASIL